LYCPAVGCVTTTFASVNTFPPPTGTSDTGPSTAPPPAGALEDGALEDGALDEGALDEALPLALGAELEPLADGVVPPPEASSLPSQAARIGAPAPASATIAAQRSTVLRSRRPSAALAGPSACGGVVAGAIVSSLMNPDLQEPADRSS
jgi:hypothetical protein